MMALYQEIAFKPSLCPNETSQWSQPRLLFVAISVFFFQVSGLRSPGILSQLLITTSLGFHSWQILPGVMTQKGCDGQWDTPTATIDLWLVR